MAPSRPLARTLVVLGALALLAGCGDDGGETTAGSGLAMPTETTGLPDTTDPTTTEAEAEAEAATTTTSTTVAADPQVAPVCEGLAGAFPDPVAGEAVDDARVVAALEQLAAEGEEPLRSHAEALVMLQAVDSGEVDAYEMDPEEAEALYADALAGAEAIHVWALDACPTSEVVWSCVERESSETFRAVGEAIEGPDGEGEIVTTTTEPGAPTPEAVYPEAEADALGDPVEVSRTDDEVVVAWLDEAGHALKSLTVVDDGGWRHGGELTCQALADDE